MRLIVTNDRRALAALAAQQAGRVLSERIAAQGRVRVIAATGTSQLDFLDQLTNIAGIDWKRVELFHLDEYIGLPSSHPASFRKYLRERLIDRVGITHYHLLDGEHDPASVIAEVGAQLQAAPVDIAFAGIGENGHLAFNDPPADFNTEAPYIIVELDEACRRQQLGEGWFRTLDDVPRKAISMTIRQILKAREILCVVPERRKADAVSKCLQGPISPETPASALRTHPNTFLYLDKESASLLNPELIAVAELPVIPFR